MIGFSNNIFIIISGKINTNRPLQKMALECFDIVLINPKNWYQ